MNNKRVSIIVLALTLSLILSGCFGGTKTPTPTPRPSKISGTISIPEGSVDVAGAFSLLASANHAEAKGTIGLAGATVQALQLPGLNPIGDSTVTDADGHYILTGLPIGEPVIIMATTSDVPPTRVSTFVERVSQTTQADADPATTLATEAFAGKLEPGSSFTITKSSWETARLAAEDIIAKLDSDEYAKLLIVGEGALGEIIGSGLTEQYDAISEQVPDENDLDIDQAKAMVQSLRDAGYSLFDTVETQLHQHSQNIDAEVAPFLQNFGNDLHDPMVQLYDLFLIYEFATDSQGSFMEKRTQQEWRDYCLDLPWDWHYHEPFPCEDALAEFEWRFVQTSTGPSDTIHLTAQDGLIYKLAVTDDKATISVEGDGVDHLFNMTMIGDSNDFYPSEMWIEGHLITSRINVTMDGWLTVGEYHEFDDDLTLPNKILFSGEIRSKTPHIVISADLEFEYEAPSAFLEDVQAISIKSSGSLEFPTLKIDGDFFVQVVPVTILQAYDSEIYESIMPVPRTMSIEGSFSDREGTQFRGFFGLEVDTDPLDRAIELTYVPATLTFEGDVKTPQYPAISLMTTIEWVEEDQLISTIEYSRGADTLSGNAVITMGRQDTIEITLTNQDGLVVTLQYETDQWATGTITKDGKKLAEVDISWEGIVFYFEDGTFQTLG